MKVIPLFLLVLIVGCDGASEPARDNMEDAKTLSDDIHGTLEKADDVEKKLMDAKDDLDDALDEALGE